MRAKTIAASGIPFGIYRVRIQCIFIEKVNTEIPLFKNRRIIKNNITKASQQNKFNDIYKT